MLTTNELNKTLSLKWNTIQLWRGGLSEWANWEWSVKYLQQSISISSISICSPYFWGVLLWRENEGLHRFLSCFQRQEQGWNAKLGVKPEPASAVPSCSGAAPVITATAGVEGEVFVFSFWKDHKGQCQGWTRGDSCEDWHFGKVL